MSLRWARSAASIDHCPEFKGIKTLCIAHVKRCNVLITALNSKGLRQGRASSSPELCIDHCPEFKGIKTDSPSDVALVTDKVTALNSKGLRRTLSADSVN